jgi:hypothetical protein
MINLQDTTPFEDNDAMLMLMHMEVYLNQESWTILNSNDFSRDTNKWYFAIQYAKIDVRQALRKAYQNQ